MRKLKLALRVLLPVLVALPVAVPAEARAPAPAPQKGGVYKGETSQEHPVRFNISRSGKRATGEVGEVVDCGTFALAHREGVVIRLGPTAMLGGGYEYEQDVPEMLGLGQGLKGTWRHTLRARFSRPSKGPRVYQALNGRWRAHLTIRDAAGTVIHECDSGMVSFETTLGR